MTHYIVERGTKRFWVVRNPRGEAVEAVSTKHYAQKLADEYNAYGRSVRDPAGNWYRETWEQDVARRAAWLNDTDQTLNPLR